MPNKVPKQPADYIRPLNINGLEGRMLHLPPPNKKTTTEILFVYGHHSSLERWWGLMLVLNRSAGVTMPDLPGFGGMDSFYKIGKKPSLDAMADYLAAFVKMRYRRKKFVLAGLSFGFLVATRMLQKYPELTKQVVLLVSIVGFSHKDDFTFSRPRRLAYIAATRIAGQRPLSWLFRYVALHPRTLRAVYARTHNARHKFASASTREEFETMMDIEIGLWHDNEVRTYMYTSREMLRVDNCTKRVDLPVWHVSAKQDNYFDRHYVEQHLRIVFKDVTIVEAKLDTHAPSVIADEKMAAPLVPTRLRKVLSGLR